MSIHYYIITLLYLHSASSMGSDVVCSSGDVDSLVQLPAVHGYGHGGQVAGKYLCPVVGKQLPDYNVGLSINYIGIANSL